MLRQHLATLAIAGDDPIARLAAAIGDRDLDSAADPAADWTPRDAPAWARPLLALNRGLVAEIAVFRAATGVPDEDSRIAGPEQHPVRTRAVQPLLETNVVELLGRCDDDASRWHSVLDDINGHIRRDAYYPRPAARLATAARTGVDVRRLLAEAAARGPLPDELPAAALWWRLAATLSPATLDDPGSRLRRAWTPVLHKLLGTALADAITADPAWPSLVAPVSTADRHRWTPLNLLTAAAEHLRDADPDGLLRPDQCARLLAYSIELFTTDHVFPRDIPVAKEPPPTPEDDEELRVLVPDPEVEYNDSALLDAPGLATGNPAPPVDDPVPPDRLGSGHDDMGGLDFEDLARQRPVAPPLRPALDDVNGLRRQAQQARDRGRRTGNRCAPIRLPRHADRAYVSDARNQSAPRLFSR